MQNRLSTQNKSCILVVYFFLSTPFGTNEVTTVSLASAKSAENFSKSCQNQLEKGSKIGQSGGIIRFATKHTTFRHILIKNDLTIAYGLRLLSVNCKPWEIHSCSHDKINHSLIQFKFIISELTTFYWICGDKIVSKPS